MSERRVVVTGLGPVTAIGVGAGDFWNALLEKKSGVKRLQAFDPSPFASQLGCEVAGLAIADAVPKRERKAGKIMARDIILAVVAAHRAVLDAGLRTKCIVERADVPGEVNLESARFGANIGAGLICADLSELAEALYSAAKDGEFSLAAWGSGGMENLTPLWLLKFLPNMLACHVTIVHDAQGPSNTITCSEASSHLAIGEAFRTVARGVADVCICGGAESQINPMGLQRNSFANRLSKRNDTPESACRPFAADRDGTILAEGGGLVIIEELEHARRRGARIYAELVGFGAAYDAQAPMQPAKPHADGRGITISAKKALRDAHVSPEQVRLIGSFASGLIEHDRAEAAGLKTLFGDRVSQIPVMNVRAGTGMSGAGAGAIDFIATTLAVYNKTIPAAFNSKSLDPACAHLKVISDGPIDSNAECAVSLAYAISGGQHAALVLKSYREGA